VTQDRRDEIERLFHLWGKGVGSYVLARVGDPELAEEITARVFLTVVRRFDQLRGSAVGWLWAIVRSELARQFRGRNHHPTPLDDLPARDEPPPDGLIRRETEGRLQDALAHMDEEQQRLIYLKFFLEMRNVDIAAALEMTPSHVGVSLHRALKELRQRLETPLHRPEITQTEEIRRESSAR
jgi:RNA polymerase sigma-70 factor (ECF subfamily)